MTELGSEEGRLPEQLQSEAQAGGHGTKAVIVALLANLGIAVAKFVGYLVTGASSMLAEALHWVADSSNQAMLLAGGRLARRQPTPAIPSGTAGSATSPRSWSRWCCSPWSRCSRCMRATRSCGIRMRWSRRRSPWRSWR